MMNLTQPALPTSAQPIVTPVPTTTQPAATSGSKPTILFVDDEQDVLDCLKRMFRKHTKKWTMHFVTSAQEAWKVAETAKIDLLITDMKMPVLDGSQVLNYFAEHSPSTVRYVLSGHADTESLERCRDLIHMFVHKPATLDQLQAAIEQAVGAERS